MHQISVAQDLDNLLLQRQLVSMSSKDDTVSVSSTSISARDQLKADIDAIVASECLYCGEMMIKSVVHILRQ